MKQFIEAALQLMTSQPDAGGHFGTYGGRYAPEVLMSPLEELELTYDEARKDPAFHAELDELLTTYAGRPTPLYFARRLSAGPRREDLHQARRPAPHRRAQDQQLPRPGAARAAHGQAPHHRRNRRGPARRRHRHRLRALRLRLHRLHGRGGHAPPAPQRLPHAPARRERRRRDQRQPHPQRRHQRSHARLGHQRRRPRIICSAPRSARIPIRPWCAISIASSASKRAARFWKPKAACPTPIFACVGGGSNAIGIFHPFIEDEGVKLIGVEAGGRRLDARPARRAIRRRISRRSPRLPQLHSAGRTRPDFRHAFRLRRTRLRLRRPGTRLAARSRPRRILLLLRQRRHRSRDDSEPHRRHHSGARIRARRGRSDPPRAGLARARSSS